MKRLGSRLHFLGRDGGARDEVFIRDDFGGGGRSGAVGRDDGDFVWIALAEPDFVGLGGACAQGEGLAHFEGVDRSALARLFELGHNAVVRGATASGEHQGLGGGQAKNRKGGQFLFCHVELQMIPG